jgi:hypothetical protein
VAAACLTGRAGAGPAQAAGVDVREITQAEAEVFREFTDLMFSSSPIRSLIAGAPGTMGSIIVK